MSGAEAILAEIADLKKQMARESFRPAWIEGYVALGRYIGSKDAKGRKARAWAVAEGLKCKMINGTPHFSIVDVDRAMRNGRAIETRRAG